jgi:hypothetical protein
MKNTVFWDVTRCGFFNNQYFGGKYRQHPVSSSMILSALMMEAIGFSGMSVLIRATRLHTQEDGILHRHCRET